MSQWICSKLCKPPGVISGITEGNDGIIYFTVESSLKIFKLVHDGFDTKHELVLEGTANGRHHSFHGIVWNEKNNTFYICDWSGHGVFQYTPKATNISHFAGCVQGKESEHEDGSILLARFSHPDRLDIDQDGNLYLTEGTYVRKIQDGIVSTLAGTGQKSHKDGKANEAAVNTPHGIAVSKDGSVYIADRFNYCIRKIKDGMVSTIAGRKGEKDKTPGGEFRGLAMDADGNLIVSEDKKVRKLDLKTNSLSTLVTLGEVVYSVMVSRNGDIYAAGGEGIYKIENVWKRERLLWIGYLKEEVQNCLLATLPKDIIREIATHLLP